MRMQKFTTEHHFSFLVRGRARRVPYVIPGWPAFPDSLWMPLISQEICERLLGMKAWPLRHRLDDTNFAWLDYHHGARHVGVIPLHQAIKDTHPELAQCLVDTFEVFRNPACAEARAKRNIVEWLRAAVDIPDEREDALNTYRVRFPGLVDAYQAAAAKQALADEKRTQIAELERQIAGLRQA